MKKILVFVSVFSFLTYAPAFVPAYAETQSACVLRLQSELATQGGFGSLTGNLNILEQTENQCYPPQADTKELCIDRVNGYQSQIDNLVNVFGVAAQNSFDQLKQSLLGQCSTKYNTLPTSNESFSSTSTTTGLQTNTSFQMQSLQESLFTIQDASEELRVIHDLNLMSINTISETTIGYINNVADTTEKIYEETLPKVEETMDITSILAKIDASDLDLINKKEQALFDITTIKEAFLTATKNLKYISTNSYVTQSVYQLTLYANDELKKVSETYGVWAVSRGKLKKQRIDLYNEIKARTASMDIETKESTPPLSQTEIIFQNDILLSPYANSISSLKQKGIISGYSDGTFKPKNLINRAEFMKIVMGAASIEATGDNCFKDVKKEWFAGYICMAKLKKITNGYPDGTFKPDKNINVVEALKIVLKAFQIETPEARQGEEWYAPYIVVANSNNLYLSTFDSPNKQVSREEMAELINRLLN